MFSNYNNKWAAYFVRKHMHHPINIFRQLFAVDAVRGLLTSEKEDKNTLIDN